FYQLDRDTLGGAHTADIGILRVWVPGKRFDMWKHDVAAGIGDLHPNAWDGGGIDFVYRDARRPIVVQNIASCARKGSCCGRGRCGHRGDSAADADAEV